jgi:tetratricopeptide (TPR) repeat protein
MSKPPSFQQMDFTMAIRNGITAIRADSIETGLHLVVSGFDQMCTLSKVDRIMDYSDIEFFELAKQIDAGKLSVEEKDLGLHFVKSMFTDPGGPTELKLLIYLNVAPNTLFVRRITAWVRANYNTLRLGELLDGLLREKPELLSVDMLKAEWLFQQGKYQECIRYCDKCIKLFPSYAFAYNLRSKCEGDLNQPEKELADNEEALTLFPAFIPAWYNKGTALYDLEKYKDAIQAFLKVYKIIPGYNHTRYFLAKCYRSLGLADSALYFVDQHIRQYPQDSEGCNLKGGVFYDKDDYPAAIEWYTQAIKLQPDDPSNYEDRGDAWFYNKNIDTALLDFEKASNMDKKRAYDYERIGDCYYEKEQYDKSITYHKKALQIDRTYKDAWVSINYCYTKMAKYDLAIIACRKAIAIDSTYDSALGNLGWDYYCVGRFDDCIAYSYKALKYDESATYAMFNIPLAILCKGDFEKSKELYQHFLDLCKEKKYKMTGGATEDLRDLIKKSIMVEQATYIIKNIFKEDP